jgi:transglutaminase-like putative cysteine protease
MLIRLGYDIQFQVAAGAPMIAHLNVHPARTPDLLEPDLLRLDPPVDVEQYLDSFGNLATRFLLPPGRVRIYNSTLIQDSGQLDAQNPLAEEVPVERLPAETLRYLLASRYCEVDLLMDTASQLFGGAPRGWGRVQAVCEWVHRNVTFGYHFARSNRTALEVYAERVGVCRDFQHLAVTFCRCLNIPARYATGYLGDIGVPLTPPMDFSAWFEAHLDGRWWTFDARHNAPRIGRVLIGVGRDATDVAITTSFGNAELARFDIVADEVSDGQMLTELSA